MYAFLRNHRGMLAGIGLVVLSQTQHLRSEDWPQWRGQNRDGVLQETGLVEKIPPTGLKVRWRAKVGRGYSGPVVAKCRVFVNDQVFQPELERVLCFDEGTGKMLWTHSYPVDYEKMEYGNGPRASPTVHEGRVYTLGTQGDFCCLDAATGKPFWQKDLQQEYKAEIPRYGASVAPIVEGDLVIVCIGGKPEASVIAFDRISGKERWKALKDEAGYSAPIVVERGGTRQLIVWTADNLLSLNPANGEVYWKQRWPTGFDAAQVIATPVLHGQRLLCVMGWNRGSMMLKLDEKKPTASIVWRTRSRPTTTMSTPIMISGEHFYTIDNVGGLCCQKAESGEELWRTTDVGGSNPNNNAHMTPFGEDRVFLFNQRGQLISARLTPKGYQETGRTLLVEPTAAYRAQGPLVWSHPAYANKHVFARNDRVLVRASLEASEYPAIDRPLTQTEIKPRVLSEFKGPRSALTLDFSPDGKTLALGSWGGQVKFLDVASGSEQKGHATKPFRNNCVGVKFSPNGKLLAYVGGSEFDQGGDLRRTAKVLLYDVTKKKLLGDWPGHKSKVTAAVFSPDGKTLATGSADNTIRLWDITTGKTRAVLTGHTDAVWSLAFTPDGQTLVSAGWDDTLRFWNPITGAELQSLNAHEEEILSVVISPDGSTIATGSGDWTIKLWDTKTRKPVSTLEGHHGSVYCLAFSPDGKTLASGSGDETVRLWDLTTRKERKTLRGHQSGLSALAFSPDGKTLATAGRDDPVRVWKLSPTP